MTLRSAAVFLDLWVMTIRIRKNTVLRKRSVDESLRRKPDALSLLLPHCSPRPHRSIPAERLSEVHAELLVRVRGEVLAARKPGTSPSLHAPSRKRSAEITVGRVLALSTPGGKRSSTFLASPATATK
jgi:hypothetical protein